MKQINVLIIDDSNIVHVLLEKVIAFYEDINIIGSAYDGKEGVDLVKKLSPDVVIMDIGMPKMNGLDAIQEIMADKPTPIIVFSAASKNNIDVGFKAIELGAVEIIEKPYSEDMSDLKRKIDEKVIKSIRTFSDFKVMRRIKRPLSARYIESQVKAGKPEKIKIKITEENDERIGDKYDAGHDNYPVIAIAASTGGPQTLKLLLDALTPRKINAGIVIIQHMAEGFMTGFCAWLAASSAIPVILANKGGQVLPRFIYIAPGEYHLVFDESGRFDFQDTPPVQGIRPSADIMLSSIARAFRQRVIAVILTGMGCDGTEGIIKVKENGGYVIAQDEESSLIFGMPKCAFETGAVDKVLSISDMSDFIEKLCNERAGL